MARTNGSPPQVVVVTGASAGVGRATAREFAKRGAKVALLARGCAGLSAAADEVEALGGTALVIPTDVADAAAVEAAAEEVECVFGPIDVWVNNAMESVFSPVMETTTDEYRRVTEVTYLGYVYGTKAALQRMKPRDRGVIVQVGSALAYRAIPLQSAYCAAKHAIKGFTESLWSELIHDKSRVHVTQVHLPAVNTPQFHWVRSRLPNEPQPVPPIFQPEVMARAIVWAADNRRKELWVGWPTMKAILGERVIPRLLDHYLAWRGYDGQQTDEPVSPHRRDNLDAPHPADHGAHGTFDDRAIAHSPALWADTHRGTLAAAGAGLVGLAAVAIARRRG